MIEGPSKPAGVSLHHCSLKQSDCLPDFAALYILALLYLLNSLAELAVTLGQLAEPHENSNDLQAHPDGALAFQDIGQHAMLCKRIGQIASPTPI